MAKILQCSATTQRTQLSIASAGGGPAVALMQMLIAGIRSREEGGREVALTEIKGE